MDDYTCLICAAGARSVVKASDRISALSNSGTVNVTELSKVRGGWISEPPQSCAVEFQPPQFLHLAGKEPQCYAVHCGSSRSVANTEEQGA